MGALGRHRRRPCPRYYHGSTGIGEATALHLRELGFSVLAGVRRYEDADRLREQGLTPIRLDVTIAEQLAAARTEIGGQPLAGLVNNAGITRSGPREFVPVDDVRQQMDVNSAEYWLINPDDLANAVVHVIDQPCGINLSDVTIRASGENYIY